jgi:hypothetical protein
MTAALKKYLLIAGFIMAAVFSAIVFYGHYQHVLYQNSIGASKVLTAEYTAYKKNADTAILAKTNEISALAKEKQAALDAANAAAQSQSATQAELNRLKAETAALPPDALSGKINAFIGDNQTRPTADGRFSFTRPGAENTLNLFYERDAYQIQNGAYQTEILNLRMDITKSDAIIAAGNEKYSLKDGECIKLLAAFDARGDALKHLQHSILGRQVKTFIIGAGIGAGTVFILHAVGIIK